jgi:spermidine/putrescine transport system ATP-binding protein
MLQLSGLQKNYGANQVVKGVSLEIREGEFFGLLGPSGCGKTTLLRMIGGFEAPDSGQILFEGRRVDLLPPHQRNFNTVFQRYALFPHLNVRENVAFGLRMKKVPPAEIQRRVEESLALVRMQGFAERAVNRLSGGQQQRVALARALVNEPKVLLLDEPLSALDLKLRQEMQVELREIQRRLKITFIFVTHDQEEALTLSDRIAVMNAGRVEQLGTPREIYETPGSEFVAGFIGSINSLAGRFRGIQEDLIVVSSSSLENVSFSIADRALGVTERSGEVFSAAQRSSLEVDADVRVLIRPERIRLLRSAPKPRDNRLRGKVREVIYQGPLSRFIVEAKDGAVLTAVQSNVFQGAREVFSVGDEVFASWAPEDCVVLPRECAPTPVEAE